MIAMRRVPAATTLPSPPAQLRANVDAGNSPPRTSATAPASIFIMPGGEGVQVSSDTLRHA